MFAVFGWPSGKTAEMIVEVCQTENEARQIKIAKSEKFPMWRFRVAPVKSEA